MKIYSCFCFFNEFNLLKIQLDELQDVVDIFVIIESRFTLSGKPRKLQLQDKLDQFKSDKYEIRYYTLDTYDLDKLKIPGHVEDMMFDQREMFSLGLYDAEDDDIILSSDIDEIPRNIVVEQLYKINNPVVLNLQFFYYYFNTPIVAPKKPQDYTCNNAILVHRYRDLKNVTNKSQRLIKDYLPRVKNAGWHFSHLNTPNELREKYLATSHIEYSYFGLDPYEKIKARRESLTDPYERPGVVMQPIMLDSFLPNYVIQHQNELKDYIYKI